MPKFEVFPLALGMVLVKCLGPACCVFLPSPKRLLFRDYFACGSVPKCTPCVAPHAQGSCATTDIPGETGVCVWGLTVLMVDLHVHV